MVGLVRKIKNPTKKYDNVQFWIEFWKPSKKHNFYVQIKSIAPQPVNFSNKSKESLILPLKS